MDYHDEDLAQSYVEAVTPGFIVSDEQAASSRLGAVLKRLPSAASRWVCRKLVSGRNDARLPTLPAERARPITPGKGAGPGADPRAAVAHSAFFRTLPVEMRRRILVEAFGGRTVHMDLFYDHPPRAGRAARGGGGGRVHCDMRLHKHGFYDESRVKVRDWQPKRWFWRSSVCHLNVPTAEATGRAIQPSQDMCRFGVVSPQACDAWAGEHPGKCFIEAMGWLRACRQAYVEGIDVLYATNTIHSASKELLYNVDRFLLPQRLARIASVQLMWEFDAPRLHDRARRVPTFKQFLNAVPAMFPRVRQLYLTVQWRTPLPPRADVPRTTTREEFEMAEDIVMRPVDRMVRRLGAHVRECSVAIPSTMYGPRRRQAKRAGQRVEQMCYGDAVERFWRPVADAAHLAGYWVRHGHKDITFHIHWCPVADEWLPLSVHIEDWVLFHG